MMILKVTKKQGVTSSLENTDLEKPQGVQITAPSLFRFTSFISKFLFLKNSGSVFLQTEESYA